MAVMISISWWVYPRKQRQQRHNDDEPLRVAIVGAGAIGTIIGLRMSKSRRIERILLVGRDSLRKALQDSNGRITIQDNAKKQQSIETFVSGKDFDVAFWDDKDLKRRLEDFHVIVLAVKTVSTKVVGGRLASMLPSDSKTTIVSL
jgi:ketopantoate reductase